MRIYKKILSIILLTLFLFTLSISFNTKSIASGADYYSGISNSLTGSSLKSALRNLITSTHTKTTSYSSLKTYLQEADEDPNNSGKMLLFYTGESISKTSDMNIWNREHVWPQSLGWFETSGAGADMHHIRPCDPSVNGSRGNKKFGTSSSYYDPNSQGANYRGDVARIIFYMFTRYSQSDSYDFTDVAQSLDMLLDWNNEDPVSETETIRNDYAHSIQGNRNPFIDNSNYANLIWGDGTTGSGSGTGSGSTDTGSGDNTGSDTGSTGGNDNITLEGNQVAIFEFGSNSSELETDGTETSSYTETYGDYTLNITNGTKLYKDSTDAKGDACLKVGSGSSSGSFTFTVPSNVTQVVIKVAGYKDKTANISINSGDTQTINTLSSNGEYTDVIIDTSATKTITLKTITGGFRCKVTSIIYYVIDESSGDNTGGENDGDNTGGDSGSTGGNDSTTLPGNQIVIFDLGEDNQSMAETDGTLANSYQETKGSYTLTLDNLSQIYTGAYDAKGNACLKVGSGSNKGTFSFTVPNDITQVVIKVTGYKSNSAKISINDGETQNITTYSTNAEYTDVIVDTSTNKTVTFTTITGGLRCKITSIAYFTNNSTEGDPSDEPKSELDIALDTYQNSLTNSSLRVNYTINEAIQTLSSDYVYKKITNASELTDGKYLLVYEDGSNAYIFSGVDATKDYVTNTISNNSISTDEATSDSYAIEIASMSGGYSLKVKNGYMYGTSGSNKLNFNNSTAQANAITFNSDGSAHIKSNSSVMRFNAATDQMRFRYYKSTSYSSQKAVYLYKLSTNIAESPQYTIDKLDLRFGTCISAELYNTLIAEGATFGVALGKTSSIGSMTMSEAYEAGKLSLVPVTPANVDKNDGTGSLVTNGTGSYYQFAAFINNIPSSAYSTGLVGACYVLIDGEYYFMNAKTITVTEVAQIYINNATTYNLTDEEIQVLNQIVNN